MVSKRSLNMSALNNGLRPRLVDFLPLGLALILGTMPRLKIAFRFCRNQFMVVFITQDADEIVSCDIANVLVQQCPTQIHMANERSTKSDYVDGLKLTEGQYEALSEIEGGQGKFLLIQGRESIVLQLPLHGMDEFIQVLSAREEDLTADDQVEIMEVAE
jgi:type IV secretory pathway VirB4 component